MDRGDLRWVWLLLMPDRVSRQEVAQTGWLGLFRGSGELYAPVTAAASRFPYSMTTRSVFPLPKVSGWYISSALAGGTTKTPGVVARAT